MLNSEGWTPRSREFHARALKVEYFTFPVSVLIYEHRESG